jgi:hypothetical protein
MKKVCFVLITLLLLALPSFAQNIAINTDASLPNPNAILDIKSGTKGLLIPRMSSEARMAITNTKGLLVYDTTTNGFWFNTGTEWQSIASGPLAASILATTGAWLLTGNSSTVDTVNFLGTTDNVPLNFRVNNYPSGQIDPIMDNTAFGYGAGSRYTVAYDNVAIGNNALAFNSTGSSNVAVGFIALAANSTGNSNTAVGEVADVNATTGNANVAVGSHALQGGGSGSYNTALGAFSISANNTGHFTGNDNVATGFQALFSITEVSNLTAIGTQSLYSNTTGQGNNATGYQSLYTNTTGYYNTATGYQSMYSNTTAFHGTANGYQSLYSNTTGDGNTANGFQSLYLNLSGNNNTADGYFALYTNNTGHENLAAGQKSLYANTSGYYNTALGFSALDGNSSGPANTAVGAGAMVTNTTGNSNTAVGAFSDVTTGNLTNATALGFGAIVDASDKVRIGNSAVTVIEGQVPFTTPSDGRYKFNVREDVKGLDFILQLRPVTYQFDVKRFDAHLNHGANNDATFANYAMQAGYDEATRIRRTGFIAQEVEQAADKSGYDFSGIVKPKTEQDHYSLSYDAFVVPLVKAVQEQQKIIETLNKKLTGQQETNETQNQKIADLQQQLDEIKKLLRASNSTSTNNR